MNDHGGRLINPTTMTAGSLTDAGDRHVQEGGHDHPARGNNRVRRRSWARLILLCAAPPDEFALDESDRGAHLSARNPAATGRPAGGAAQARSRTFSGHRVEVCRLAAG
jgi:hypothetical protein